MQCIRNIGIYRLDSAMVKLDAGRAEGGRMILSYHLGQSIVYHMCAMCIM